MIRLHVNHMDGKESEMAVSELMRSLRFQNFNVTQGCIELFDNENPQRISQLGASLLTIGCALVYDHKTILVQRIAHIVSDLINNHDNLPDVKLSVYLSEKLNLNYNYLSNIFSEQNCISLRQFIINKRIDKVKKLLLHSGMNVTEIALMLNYSSVAHLSTQFKKTTGISPSEFKFRKNGMAGEQKQLQPPAVLIPKLPLQPDHWLQSPESAIA